MLSLADKLEAFRDGCEEGISEVLCTPRRLQAFRAGWYEGLRETLDARGAYLRDPETGQWAGSEPGSREAGKESSKTVVFEGKRVEITINPTIETLRRQITSWEAEERPENPHAWASHRYLEFNGVVYTIPAESMLHGNLSVYTVRRENWDISRTGFIFPKDIEAIKEHPDGLLGWIKERHSNNPSVPGSWGGVHYVPEGVHPKTTRLPRQQSIRSELLKRSESLAEKFYSRDIDWTELQHDARGAYLRDPETGQWAGSEPGSVESIKEQPRLVSTLGKPFEVLVNPTEQDLYSLAKDAYENLIRIIVDHGNNLFAWEAVSAIHAAVGHQLNIEAKEWRVWGLRQGKLVDMLYYPSASLETFSEQQRKDMIKRAAAEVRTTLAELRKHERMPVHTDGLDGVEIIDAGHLRIQIDDAAWEEEKHPRGGEKNKGQFTSKGMSEKEAKPKTASKEEEAKPKSEGKGGEQKGPTKEEIWLLRQQLATRAAVSAASEHVAGGNKEESKSAAKETAGLLERLKTEGGFTYNVQTATSPKEGFVVSPYKQNEQVLEVKDLTPADLARYVVENRDLLSQPDHYFGSWHNKDDGKVYLDVAIVAKDAQTAEQLCQQHDQLAYFDLKKMETVNVQRRKTRADAAEGNDDGGYRGVVRADQREESDREAAARGRENLGREDEVVDERGEYKRDPESGEFAGSYPGTPETETEQRARRSVRESTEAALKKGVKLLPGSQGHPNLIATRLPTAVHATEKGIYAQPDMESFTRDPKTFARNMELLRTAVMYPNVRSGGGIKQLARNFIDQAKSNLKFLYEHSSDREDSKLWYDGVRNMVNDRATTYHYNDASVAGVYAALSPQKEWDMNVYLGDALIKIHSTQQTTKWDDKMSAKADEIWKRPEVNAALEHIRGKALGELTDPADKAIWIRTYDEAHNTREYREVLPTGELGELVRNKGKGGKPGKPALATWQTNINIENAIRALEANGDREIINEAMPSAHKVRSFYNNILDPHSKNDDVTIDTHAVGAALMRQLSGGSGPVLHNFGLTPDVAKRPPGWKGTSPSSEITGLTGMYALYATAYREAARELGIKPRQLQSIVWVTKRNTFGELNKTQIAQVEKVWHTYHSGKLSLEETQQQVWEIARGSRR